jgi:hypothetical protein
MTGFAPLPALIGALGALAIVTSAHAVPTAPAAVAAPSAGDLTAAAAAARYGLATDPDRLLAQEDPVSRAAFLRALRPGGSAALDPIWSTLAAGAVQTRLQSARNSATLWFNPVFDAGIAILWRRGADGWVAVAVTPVLVETLRGEPIDPNADLSAPRWPLASDSLAGGLTSAAQADNGAAASGNWIAAFTAPASVRSDWTNAVVARVFFASNALRLMELDPRYRGALAGIRAQLVEDDSRSLPSRVRDELAKTGAAGRLSLRPVAALRRPDGWSVVLQSPDAVGAAWFAHFVDPQSGQAARPAAFTVAPLIAPPTTPEPAR